MAIRIIIEGVHAVDAAEDLIGSGGVVGQVDVAPQDLRVKDFAAVVAVATIVAGVGGVTGIIDSVLGWRDRLREKYEKPLRVVVIVGDERSVLDDLDDDEIAYLLESDPGVAGPGD